MYLKKVKKLVLTVVDKEVDSNYKIYVIAICLSTIANSILICFAIYLKIVPLILSCGILLFLNLLSFTLVKLKKVIGYHLFYIGFQIILACISYTSLVYYPTFLIYPIALVLSLFSWTDFKIRLLYLTVNISCVIIHFNNLYKNIDYGGTLLEKIMGIIIIIVPLLFLLLISFLNTTAIEIQKKRLEENQVLILEKNRKLQEYIESNIQLEKFASIASHDLSGPLITINSFAKLLKFRLKSKKLSELEHKSLNYLESSSQDLLELIEDLLLYSKVNSQQLNKTDVAIKGIVKNVVDMLVNLETMDNVAISIDDSLPTLNCDAIKIKRVFQNLIANSIRFRKLNQPLKIDISCKIDNKFCSFFIKDNGIGIEFTKVNIFDLHTRLNNKTDYKGTGMGLSICKKIIEQHGGNIDYTSKYGEGSTFFFTLPL